MSLLSRLSRPLVRYSSLRAQSILVVLTEQQKLDGVRHNRNLIAPLGAAIGSFTRRRVRAKPSNTRCELVLLAQRKKNST